MGSSIVVGRLQCDDDVAIVGQGQSSTNGSRFGLGKRWPQRDDFREGGEATQQGEKSDRSCESDRAK